MAKLLTRCPVCEGTLGISELTCGRCQTRIQGTFDPCRFCRLPPEHLTFIETFLRCEGNLSRVEKELGLSYPTVRNKLTAALAALGFSEEAGNDGAAAEARFGFAYTPPVPPTPPVGPEAGERRRQILEALAQGTMSAEDAAEALRELG
jgi:hypothetical protein